MAFNEQWEALDQIAEALSPPSSLCTWQIDDAYDDVPEIAGPECEPGMRPLDIQATSLLRQADHSRILFN